MKVFKVDSRQEAVLKNALDVYLRQLVKMSKEFKDTDIKKSIVLNELQHVNNVLEIISK